MIAATPDLATAKGDALDEAINGILGSLKASHTARYTSDTVAYYELADIFRGALRREARRLFPPEGEVAYFGAGIVTEEIDEKVFVSDVYSGSAAEEAGVMAGDEIVSGDAGPAEAAGTVTLSLRRSEGAPPIAVDVPLARLEATDTLLQAIRDSAEIIDIGTAKFGYVRLWTHASDAIPELLADVMTDGVLKEADGLILDLRGRWGGAPADAADFWLGRAADAQMIYRDGDARHINYRWRKPVVAIIDEGSRSGMEMLAYSLQKNGVTLVGEKTAGAVLAGTAFLLPDDSLLILAVADVLIDDAVRLEGVGVTPDIEVTFDIRYAAGNDPQITAAAVALTAEIEARD